MNTLPFKTNNSGAVLVVILILLLCFTLLGSFISMLLFHSIQSAFDHKEDIELNLKLHQYSNAEGIRVERLLADEDHNLPLYSINQAKGCMNYLPANERIKSSNGENFSTTIFEIDDECLVFKPDKKHYQLWINSSNDDLAMRASLTINRPKPDNTLWLDGEKTRVLSLPSRLNYDYEPCSKTCNQLEIVFASSQGNTTREIFKVEEALLEKTLAQTNYFIAAAMANTHRGYLLDRLGDLWGLTVYSDNTVYFKRLSKLNIRELTDKAFTIKVIHSDRHDQLWNIRLVMESKQKGSVVYQGVVNLSNIHSSYSFPEIALNDPEPHNIVDQSVRAKQIYKPSDFWKMRFKGADLVNIGEEQGLLRLLTKNSRGDEWLWLVYRDGVPFLKAENIYGLSQATRNSQAILEECTPEMREKIYFDHWIVGCTMPNIFNREWFYQ